LKLVLTCEHANNALPKKYRSYFSEFKQRLETHEGYDLGAFSIFKNLKPLATFSSSYPWSRLLIEVNRSLQHSQLFSSISKSFSEQQKRELIEEYYRPYREEIQKKIYTYVKQGESVLHLSVHSFTPILNGDTRNTEVGLLYDPRRSEEKKWAMHFKKNLYAHLSNQRIRMNYPYLGKADGFTTSLRHQFQERYIGIELELNQKLLVKEEHGKYLSKALYKSIQKNLDW
jgi:predicted N-formylglutamate amidohydrolase